ncbi:GNAT family N-acetyltransferase [Pinirhizobacter sp.]|jgi:ribosomal-protein-alanine N-acetyltransferase|uniref:GNAT family N-acetyltransferase n=1 Tax=Pinirhizobacter sp. TaxID=2950432 RepID=UPI002F3EE08D
MSTPVLRTPRTECRLARIPDARAVHAYRIENRAHLAPWEPLREDGYYTLEGARTSIVQWSSVSRAGVAWPFVIFEPDSGQMIGSFTFANIVRGVFQAAHLGYGLAAAWQGQGVMAEALRAGLQYAFGPLDLHRVMANYMPRNERSGQLLQALGFEREGMARGFLKIHGVWEDHVLTSKVRDD